MNNEIMLSTKNLLNARFKKKLFYKFIESFEIENIVDKQTCRLRLLKKWRIYLVFYVFLLELYHRNANTIVSKNIILVDKNKK